MVTYNGYTLNDYKSSVSYVPGDIPDNLDYHISMELDFLLSGIKSSEAVVSSKISGLSQRIARGSKWRGEEFLKECDVLGIAEYPLSSQLSDLWIAKQTDSEELATQTLDDSASQMSHKVAQEDRQRGTKSTISQAEITQSETVQGLKRGLDQTLATTRMNWELAEKGLDIASEEAIIQVQIDGKDVVAGIKRDGEWDRSKKQCDYQGWRWNMTMTMGSQTSFGRGIVVTDTLQYMAEHYNTPIFWHPDGSLDKTV